MHSCHVYFYPILFQRPSHSDPISKVCETNHLVQILILRFDLARSRSILLILLRGGLSLCVFELVLGYQSKDDDEEDFVRFTVLQHVSDRVRALLALLDMRTINVKWQKMVDK